MNNSILPFQIKEKLTNTKKRSKKTKSLNQNITKVKKRGNIETLIAEKETHKVPVILTITNHTNINTKNLITTAPQIIMTQTTEKITNANTRRANIGKVLLMVFITFRVSGPGKKVISR